MSPKVSSALEVYEDILEEWAVKLDCDPRIGKHIATEIRRHMRMAKLVMVQAKEMTMRHCDDYLNDAADPKISAWVRWHRSPALAKYEVERPLLFATWNGRRVDLTMASRFGDVGVRFVGSPAGPHICYEERGIMLDELQDFSDQP